MAIELSVSRRVRLFTVVMGTVFIVLGVAKLIGISPTYAFFEQLNLPRTLVPIVGVLEILVGVLTINRSTHSYGAVGVVVLMGGAALAHVMSGAHLYMLFLNAYFLAAAIWVVRMDRPRFLRVV
jgi:uncharacterized membrane protein YphA (DoxX/SURF4 family)